jgi:glutamate/tyrosine decarboxylase-like PLP-dependent enzyme
VLAQKKLWQNKRKAEGKPFDKPNMIMNSAVQVCWEVFSMPSRQYGRIGRSGN